MRCQLFLGLRSGSVQTDTATGRGIFVTELNKLWGCHFSKLGLEDANPAYAWVDHNEWCQSTFPTLAIGLCEILPLRKPRLQTRLESNTQL